MCENTLGNILSDHLGGLTFDLKEASESAGRDGCRGCKAAPYVNKFKNLMDTKKITPQSRVSALG